MKKLQYVALFADGTWSGWWTEKMVVGCVPRLTRKSGDEECVAIVRVSEKLTKQAQDRQRKVGGTNG